MRGLLKTLFKKKELVTPEVTKKKLKKISIFSTDTFYQAPTKEELFRTAWNKNVQRSVSQFAAKRIGSVATDSGAEVNIKLPFRQTPNGISEAQMNWLSSMSFIGFPTCAILAQHWLIDKACSIPAEDAVRKGYKITVSDGAKVDSKVLTAIKTFDNLRDIKTQALDFIRKGRIFGVRLALFKVKVANERDYYYKPFNPDSITPGSYLGIAQIDPYWTSPQLDAEAVSNPMALDFYEPTWWYVNGLMIHKSHFVIYRNSPPSDILKPTYYYGGISVPQQIFERCYAAERSANEAPQLLSSKRTGIIKLALAKATANLDKFYARMTDFAAFLDNFSVKVIDTNDTYEQHDTNLGDVDTTITTQYQLVAAAARVPVTKLMGTSTTGLNSTGEYNETNYHETVETVQEQGMIPLINRHHLYVIRSEIMHAFGIGVFSTCIVPEPLDALTEKEQAEINEIKARTATSHIQNAVISPEEERDRLIADENSGYDGLSAVMPKMQDDDEEDVEISAANEADKDAE